MVDWPDTPLEISMLFNGVIIHCPDKDLVDELFSFLEENDIKWYGDEPVGETHWHENREETCYRIEPRGTMKYGSRTCYSDSAYRNYIKFCISLSFIYLVVGIRQLLCLSLPSSVQPAISLHSRGSQHL